MKTLFSLIILALLYSFTGCNNDDDNGTNPVDQLPPATQTGAQTFGCLINGKPFIPDSFGSGRPTAFYQFVDGAYTFVIASSSGKGSDFKSISLGGIDVDALQEIEYALKEDISGNTYGGVIVEIDFYTTKSNHTGKLLISNFDPENFIISGTFEFTVLDEDGNEIQITDGRFDVKYTN